MLERDDLSMVAIQGPQSPNVLKNFPAPMRFSKREKETARNFSR